MPGVSWLMEHPEVNLAEEDDRAEWDRVWRARPLCRLVNPVQIDVSLTADPALGEVMRVEIAADPPQYAGAIWRQTEVCPACGEVTSPEARIAATVYPHFDSGVSYGLPCWVHQSCLAACEEVAGPAPVPW